MSEEEKAQLLPLGIPESSKFHDQFFARFCL